MRLRWAKRFARSLGWVPARVPLRFACPGTGVEVDAPEPRPLSRMLETKWKAVRDPAQAICRIAALLSLIVMPALAVEPDEILKDPALERRARDISTGLRCLVCQNQSIDDSDAPLAKDLRILVRERLQAGESDGQVRDFVVRRYGEFVLLKPVFSLRTALLWLAPLLVLAAGALGLFLTLRRRKLGAVEALSVDERASIDALLERDRPAP